MNEVHLMSCKKQLLRFMSLELNSFLQSEIKQRLSSVQKITYTIALADKNIVSVFCVSGVLCSPSQFVLQLGCFFSWNSQQKIEKVNHICKLNGSSKM